MSEDIEYLIQTIKFCKDIIGKEGPVSLNTCILYCNSYEESFNEDEDRYSIY